MVGFFLPNFKTILVIAGLFGLMAWAYMNDVFVAGSGNSNPEATIALSADRRPTLPAVTPPIEYRNVVQVNSSTFPVEVYGAGMPVVVDFYTDWCVPCKQQARILEQFAWNRGDVKIVKVNIDQDEALARQFGVTRIPTLVVVQRDQILGRHVGLADEETLKTLLP